MSESQLDRSWQSTAEPMVVEVREDLPLAAALAAALLEYQQYKRHRTEDGSSANGNAGWRTVARVEQLARTNQRSPRGQM
jgi:hypothetical protein